jgi:AcrR family transcriptional regulator
MLNSTPKRLSATDAAETTKLDQSAWLRAATTAIAEDGISGLRVLPLSKRLGVTRGSFYWHFADHAAFINAYVQYWRQQQLRAIESYTHDLSDPVSAYKKLLDTALTDDEPERRRLKVEFALRGHARRNPVAADAIADVDRARIALFLPLVEAIGHDRAEAKAFALLLLIQISGAQHAIAGPNCNAEVLTKLKQAMLESLSALHSARKKT